ncbi:MAG: Asp-tRNA(Asn)/Glu-tRNA(Gln) amidotransferase subunit GatC [bacterium]|nr:Asp-tRNA(Asn)/Glu-tRNA(Gln) amidotransferase subunit GatC [bacterium]
MGWKVQEGLTLTYLALMGFVHPPHQLSGSARRCSLFIASAPLFPQGRGKGEGKHINVLHHYLYDKLTFEAVGLILSFMEKDSGIGKEIVEYLSNLARISLSEEEKQHLTKELADIIEYVSKLSKIEAKINTSGDISITNVFREDKVKESKSAEDILSGAPEREDNFFKVPRII